MLRVAASGALCWNDSRNLLLSNPVATEVDLYAAIKVAQLDRVIAHLPYGLDTLLGPDAAGLSGGEKQRLALARALLRNAHVLILDEATSAVDLPTETALLAAMDSLYKQTSLVLISHRLRSVSWVDHIVVMENGLIVAEGRHSVLYATSSLYRALYEADHVGPPGL